MSPHDLAIIDIFVEDDKDNIFDADHNDNDTSNHETWDEHVRLCWKCHPTTRLLPLWAFRNQDRKKSCRGI